MGRGKDFQEGVVICLIFRRREVAGQNVSCSAMYYDSWRDARARLFPVLHVYGSGIVFVTSRHL